MISKEDIIPSPLKIDYILNFNSFLFTLTKHNINDQTLWSLQKAYGLVRLLQNGTRENDSST